jgi:hypothetical protein
MPTSPEGLKVLTRTTADSQSVPHNPVTAGGGMQNLKPKYCTEYMRSGGSKDFIPLNTKNRRNNYSTF